MVAPEKQRLTRMAGTHQNPCGRQRPFAAPISGDTSMTSLTPAGADTQDALLGRAMRTTATAIFITDADGRIVWANAAFCDLSGYAMPELIGRVPSLLKSGMQSGELYATLWHNLRAGKVWQGEMVDRRKDGSLYTIDEVITPLLDAHGAVSHYVAIQHDITSRKAENALEHKLAYQDFVTGLPNRASCTRLYDQALDCARRDCLRMALLFVDLDHFKPVNDVLGHQVGDELLGAVGARLRAAVRRDDVVARVGGDEFAIMLSRLPDIGVAGALAQKVVHALSAPYSLQDREVLIGASIGIAVYPQDGATAETLMKHADKAMYRAKWLGGNRYHFYTTSLDQDGSPDVPGIPG
jgi:diguanylate cyclase (GGDEF)-like protein/PAS domain S-box-containing protein